MTQDKIKKIHLIYGCITALIVIAFGVAMMVSCLDIYNSGPRPYSRESIGAKLSEMAVLIWLSAGAVVGGVVLSILLPADKEKTKAVRDEQITMQKLAAKAGTPTDTEAASIRKEKTLRKVFPAVTAVLFAALLIYPGIYLFNTNNFSGVDPTAEILAASLIVMPAAVIGLALCYLCTVLTSASLKRETAIYKQIIAERKAQPVAEEVNEKPMPINIIRWAVFGVAVVFIVIGIFNGSAQDVLTKAVKICTECIGLG
ncbi:MAG: hypothetical protein IJW14_05250 [Oscillospiraceae bacterium]|nr:hypothetical protein [Oscillospiraceae bacterium]